MTPEGTCPACGDNAWAALGCANCGLEFFPPSEAYWEGTSVERRVELLREDWYGEPEPVPDVVLTPAQKELLGLTGVPAFAGYRRPRLPASASPIEIKFWDACMSLSFPVLHDLVPQYRVLNYRLDFALPDRKIGIELDGFASHSSTQDIERDRVRQRTLQGNGWTVIRFGGREVTRNAVSCAQQAAQLIESTCPGVAS